MTEFRPDWNMVYHDLLNMEHHLSYLQMTNMTTILRQGLYNVLHSYQIKKRNTALICDQNFRKNRSVKTEATLIIVFIVT